MSIKPGSLVQILISEESINFFQMILREKNWELTPFENTLKVVPLQIGIAVGFAKVSFSPNVDRIVVLTDDNKFVGVPLGSLKEIPQ